MQYLIHQNRAGDALGVWTEQDSYYPPGTPQATIDYGAAATERGTNQSWPEFAEAQASKTPSPTAQWDTYEHQPDTLENIFDAVKRDTSYD